MRNLHITNLESHLNSNRNLRIEKEKKKEIDIYYLLKILKEDKEKI